MSTKKDNIIESIFNAAFKLIFSEGVSYEHVEIRKLDSQGAPIESTRMSGYNIIKDGEIILHIVKNKMKGQLMVCDGSSKNPVYDIDVARADSVIRDIEGLLRKQRDAEKDRDDQQVLDWLNKKLRDTEHTL